MLWIVRGIVEQYGIVCNIVYWDALCSAVERRRGDGGEHEHCTILSKPTHIFSWRQKIMPAIVAIHCAPPVNPFSWRIVSSAILARRALLPKTRERPRHNEPFHAPPRIVSPHRRATQHHVASILPRLVGTLNTNWTFTRWKVETMRIVSAIQRDSNMVACMHKSETYKTTLVLITCWLL